MVRYDPAIKAPGAQGGTWRSAVKAGKRWLYWIHRWLGITTCLLCVMWFLSGLVMLYVPFPSWSDEERVAHLPPIATERIAVMPDEALSVAGVRGLPGTFRLEMLGDEPVYRIVGKGQRSAVSATTGAVIQAVGPDEARRHVAATFPEVEARLAETLDYDQWTVTPRFAAHRPLYRFALDDGRGTSVYVSSTTGEIVQNATRSERFWNWLGAVPHWVYFSPIRKDQELWRQAVLWLSGPLVIGAITGLWIGLLRLRVRRPYARGRVTPYRGWMKWHHIGGLAGGLFLTAWIFSGWLSVNPFHLFARTQLSDAQRIAYAGWREGAPYGVTTQALARAGLGEGGPTEISFAWTHGKPHMLVRNASGLRLADPASGAPLAFSDDDLIAAARRLFPDASVTSAHRVTEEDTYWYSHHRTRPLPAIKVVFADPSATWIFLDPATGAIAGVIDRSARTYRWLFSFLHDYDLPVLLRNQPARDIVVWLLSIAGLIVSVSGVVVGYRTLARRSR